MVRNELDPMQVASILHTSDAREVKRFLSSPPPSSVRTQWSRVSSILSANLGVAYFGADDAAIEEAERATCPWTDEIRELYRCVEHADHRRGLVLMPLGFEFMSLKSVVSHHELFVRLNVNPFYGEPPDIETEMAKPAGSPGPMLPGFVAFAKAGADTLFVDTRSGPLHGCVNLLPDGDAPWQAPLWRSPSAMLEQLAFSLERNATFEMRTASWGKYQPYIEGDQLVWDPK
ncbi:hypothetical protein HQ325_16725 [Rhodococcus sp. BP-349]|uniref:hypothetical protein n=1 Tax=unclassified Rhodococcus (in: high G+C Gram-positive bacteria) TaxID=192944 RepID=UPI001C9B989B|nr:MULTISPECIES: hypothetical protein [unclassified Rhodococcus (in: high G+C Gram-positive bacteria)]MBY6540320.1 hypothetical protein [Rhodococcus sp. BP-363]MBY6545655.1 hypothetical protein [Rhodococcus sp. BP-369]MBY6564885.1 hypothetical protein [Rhodococcus sp. BP-370]MBY6578179.1 hypothetical protein [Rhodococcus sp. BP-364]MBY6587480.1 hypothetical protein [Rhodococcus sp. BP-358]